MSWYTRASAALLLLATPATAQAVLEPRTLQAQGREVRAEVGHIEVPERHGKPDGAKLRIAVARLRSSAEKPGAPIFFLAGGPGDGATDTVTSRRWEALRALGDVVLVDQRGIARSEPRLTWRSPDIDPRRLFVDEASARAAMLEWAKSAASELRAKGIDPAAYTTSASADDIDVVRRELGYEKIRLLGHSYGTHLGLELLRRHGARVERAVFVGVAGPDDLLKPAAEIDPFLRRLSSLVAADAKIGKAVPDLYALAERCLAKLAKEPVTIVVADPRGEGTLEVPVGRLGLQTILLRDLGDTADLPVFPRLLTSIDRGDTRLLGWFVAKRCAPWAELPVANFALRGSAGVSPERRERIERDAKTSLFGNARNLPQPEVAAALGLVDAGDAFRAPVTSDVPVLLVSGTLDANTPPEQAERVKRTLKRSAHIVVENAGHEDLLGVADVDSRVLEFLAGKEVRDERLVRAPLTFVPLDGDASTPTHPSLGAERR